jgi:5'-nucleotidase
MKPFIRKITLEVLENSLPQGVVLNVNFPKLTKEHIKGIKICRQAKALWIEKFDKRQTPQGRDYYWLAGEFVNQDKGEYRRMGSEMICSSCSIRFNGISCTQELNTWKWNE